MSEDGNIQLLDDLQSLLEKQIALVRRGSVRDVEVLSKQAGVIVEKIVQAGIVKSVEFTGQLKKLRRLYKNLCLAIAAYRAEAAGKLNQVRKGRKTIETYRNNY